ncbi:MAG: hypothetical protein ACRELC_03065 [Gemmatimonadota bacterium]
MRKIHGLRGPGGLPIVLIVAAVSMASACSEDSISNPPPPPPPPGGNPNAGYDVAYATFLGGNGFEEIREPILLSGGRLLFGARTLSANMPTTGGAAQSQHGGGQGDSYLAMLSADGSRLEAATYFGGSGMERPPYGIGIAPDGDLIFTSGTTSPDLPTTSASYRPNLHTPVPDPGDGYVCRISGDLSSIRWCTYTGGGWPRGGLDLDSQGNPVVAGRAIGAGYTTTAGAVQGSRRGPDDAFLLKLRSDGTGAIFSTLLGGRGSDDQELAMSVRIYQADGTIVAAGNTPSADFPTTSGSAQPSTGGPIDAWVARFAPDGGSLVYATYIGGNDGDACEHRVYLLDDGTAVCAGSTASNDFPAGAGAPNGVRQAYVAGVAPDGSSFRFGRLLGGSGLDHVLSPVTDSRGNIYIVGHTTSRDLDTTPDALQPSYGGGGEDGVVWILSPDGRDVLYASYLGGSGEEMVRGIVVGPQDELYLVGRTSSSNFPVTENALQRVHGGDADGFVIKLVPRQN